MNKIAAHCPTLSATSAISHPKGTWDTSPIAILLTERAHTRETGVRVRTLLAIRDSPLLTAAKTAPTATICATTLNGSSFLTSVSVADRTSHAARREDEVGLVEQRAVPLRFPAQISKLE